YLPVSIRGVAFNDINGNHAWDDGEPILTNWPVFLDQNNNGRQDEGEISTTTDDRGVYLFQNLKPGTYIVALVVPDPWEQTFPTAAAVQAPQSGSERDTNLSVVSSPVVDVYQAVSSQAGSEASHFLRESGDGHHFAWQDHDPSTPNVIDIFYDYRPVG